MHNADVVVIGGGLAGLVSALELAQKGHQVSLVEKNVYPFHKVCGEYISKETLPLLSRLGLDPFAIGAQDIKRLSLSSPKGKLAHTQLPLGAFSISRYQLDHALAQLSVARGVNLLTQLKVNEVRYDRGQHYLTLSDGSEIKAKLVIGSYGKRSHLDRVFERPFFKKRSPYLGVKYHANLDFPADLVRLHNFQAGYCGISRVEGSERVNICFLTTREHLRHHKSIPLMMENVLHRNPLLKKELESATSLFEKPLVINEISFVPKDLVVDHILMAGDSAGMIMPLVGNGMAMAMHAAWMLAGWADGFLQQKYDRTQLERGYLRDWQKQFKLRLWAGRQLQQMFARTFWSELAVKGLASFPRIGQAVISKTHGLQFGEEAYVAKP
ncbi:MAG: NAD(P)/FAD-dependent oxidoreductase [Bacteroidota bacterium]